jgi:hypothetical protein
LTLEQKTLCEINQGIKNQNSETSPQNSVNNILRDINVDNNAAYAAINQNLKYTNDNLELLNKNAIASNINTNSLNQTGMGIKTGVDSLNTTLKSIDENIKKDGEKSDKISEGVDDAMFNETASKGLLSSIGEDYDNMLASAKQAYENVTETFENVKDNYQNLKDFIDQKKSLNQTLNLHSVSLPTSTLTVFGQSQKYTCFFNQDLQSLYAPIRPFVIFIMNIYFMFFSITFFMRYALNSGVK